MIRPGRLTLLAADATVKYKFSHGFPFYTWFSFISMLCSMSSPKKFLVTPDIQHALFVYGCHSHKQTMHAEIC